MGALSHIRVLDLSRILAGPWATQILADLGAEVIKVERPGKGDDTRAWGPPFLKDAHGRETTESAYFLSANRGKKSVTINIRSKRGQALVRDLAAQSDVFIENFRVGSLAAYGLDYDALREVNAGLIYCSITGFGATGPYKQRPGYDFLIQGMGGLMSVTGRPDEVPGGGPIKVGVAVADVLTGMYATSAIMAALVHRERTGTGQQIDLALFDVQLACLANQATNYLVSGVPPARLGNAHPNIVPYQSFATRDGHIIVAVGNDDQFRRLCDEIGQRQLGADERFTNNAGRVRYRSELVPVLDEAFSRRSSDEWLRVLAKAGVPAAPINALDRVFDDPQIRHRKMQIDMSHPLSANLPLAGSPLNFSATPVHYELPPPLLGQHTDEVLQKVLGLSNEDLTVLREQDVI